MDNNMCSVATLFTTLLGLTCGLVISSVLHVQDIQKLTYKLELLADKKFGVELELDALKEELEQEKKEKDELVAKLGRMVTQYNRLPPPSLLVRSQACPDEDECELTEEETQTVMSPDVVPSSTD